MSLRVAVSSAPFGNVSSMWLNRRGITASSENGVDQIRTGLGKTALQRAHEVIGVLRPLGADTHALRERDEIERRLRDVEECTGVAIGPRADARQFEI